MVQATTKERIYVFDSSIFINLNRINEHSIEIPKDVWDKLDELMTAERIISQRYVYEEVVMNSKTPDKVSAWLAPKKAYFFKENAEQIAFMIEVIQKYPKLINPNNEKEQADPWLVALARDKNLIEPEKSFVLVTQENPNKTVNLPAACKEYGIETINLRQFFNEVGIVFGVAFE
ncbi:MAG TPA: DUF4411 family protein [Magnetospirillaceae bacterium]|nr:DUF4411 family protein [Magnetospirillaceae bacterium]